MFAIEVIVGSVYCMWETEAIWVLCFLAVEMSNFQSELSYSAKLHIFERQDLL